MGLFTAMKAQKAYNKQAKGEYTEARALYEEAIGEGMNQPRYLLAYSILLLRTGEYQKARELLVKTQKAPGLTAEQRVQLFVNYSAAVFRLGEIDKGIDILEKQHIHGASGLVYQTLGYLYVEKYAHEPDFDALEAEAAAAAEAAQAEVVADESEAVETAETAPAVEEEKLSLREQWEAGKAKAKAFLNEAVEYDDEDAVSLDNMGQFLYRVEKDKVAAKPWFEKAHKVKEGQIDTLYFLSRYDLEAGDRAAAKEKLEAALEGRFSPLNFMSKAQIEAEVAKL